MKNLTEIKKFLKNIKGFAFGDGKYHYARQISNARFGHMPAGIAYCKTAKDVQLCINFCREKNVPFRIRSGGHQHEGMCSADDILIIDLSEIYGAKIQDDNGNAIKANDSSAWIPVGMKLAVVYTELAKKPFYKTIPGGGCQSVNVGGLTQGGGWGSSIRKFGLTCDNIDEAELVLADGSILNTATETDPKRREQILWALRGGGGGNFGVVTKFKFRLSSLGTCITTFGIRWKKTEDSIKVIKKWIDFQKGLTNDLSCTCGLFKGEGDKKDKKGKKSKVGENSVTARLGGKFYGSEMDLLALLKTLLGDLAPIEEVPGGLKPITDSKKDQYFSGINEIVQKDSLLDLSLEIVSNDQWFADFMNMDSSLEELVSLISIRKKELPNLDNVPDAQELLVGETNDGRENYTVLPNAPASTCDRPHPHKVTSIFPEKNTDHHELVNEICKEMIHTPFHSDVRKYMIWHCMGGASDNAEFQLKSAFAFRNKPYLLQLQCWWDNSGDLINDKGRDLEYVNWVNDFRENILTNDRDGAFINFVDKSLVEDISTQEGRLALLKHYYGDSLDQLREIKTKFDKDNLFEFEMSIPCKSD